MNHEVNTQPTSGSTKGFTIIELLLAMTFISVLLLAIAMTIVQIANIYNRGMILKEVNITSRAIDDELTSALRTNGSFSLDASANRYVNNAWGGRLCVGQYSYVWNYVKALNEVNTNRNQYSSANGSGNIVKDTNGTVRSEVGFVKVSDSSGAYCTPDATGRYPNVNPANATEILKAGDHNLGLHYFTVVSTTTAKDSLSSQQLYKFSYVLGTSDLGALNVDAANPTKTSCKAPGQAGSDLNYCSVQQFGLVLRVVSGVN